MNEHDTDVLDTLRQSFGGVTMPTPVEQIVDAGRTRRRRHRITGVAAGLLATGGLALGVAYGNPSPAPDGAATTDVHIHEVAYTVDTQADGTIRVTWDKSRYFTDHEGLAAALRQAGFPVTMRVGEFCLGAGDDPRLNASGIGPGVDRVMRGEGADADKVPTSGKQPAGDANGTKYSKVTLVFTPSAMPAGKQLFIGYLNDAQRARTQGRPGSIERLVSTGTPLTCTPQLPALGS